MDIRKIQLAKNTFILAIGSFSTKILSFVLVPLYTIYLNPSQYGEIDIYITILSMLYIIVSLQSIESAFRFIQDCKTNYERTIVISNAAITAITGIIVFSVIMGIAYFFIGFHYSFIFVLYVASNIICNLFLHTLRGMGKVNYFAIMGIISTVVQFVFNLILIIGLKMGAISLLLAPIIANGIVILIIFVTADIIKFMKLKVINQQVIKGQLSYSLPLIPSAIGIWLMSSIGRFILLLYYGNNEVGLLAVTLKFPQLIESLNGIFFLAWQMSSISTYNAKDRDKFASDIFNQFSVLLLTAIIILLPILKIIIFTILGNEYLEIWKYTPIFLLGIIFNSYAKFYEMGFYSAKRTNSVFYSVLISSLVYICIGLILAKSFYIIGIGIAYSVAELVHWIYSQRRVKQYLKIDIKWLSQLVLLLIILIFISIYYLGGLKIQFFMVFIGIIIIMKSNKELFKRILSLINVKVSKNR